MSYPTRTRRYTDIHHERVESPAELRELLEAGWWLPYFWIDDYHSYKTLLIHSEDGTKKLIRKAKREACQMLADEELAEDEDETGALILRLRTEDDDLLIM